MVSSGSTYNVMTVFSEEVLMKILICHGMASEGKQIIEGLNENDV